MRNNEMWETASVLLLVSDRDGVIVDYSKAAAATLGADEKHTLGEVMDGESAALLDELMQNLRPNEAPRSLLLRLIRRDGGRVLVAGLVEKLLASNGTPLLRVTVLDVPGPRSWVEEIIASEELLRAFVRTSNEAMWCIEFSEPVDLTLGEHEIVRQMFENECHWLMCNEAMARLYDLPEGLDFNKQPVSQYFPRSPENEGFIRQIIESNFSVDNALSIDTRHDGSTVYAENTVRCRIEGGRLFRMWGTVRDITSYRQVHNRLAQEAQEVRGILGALPDVVLVINRNRRLLAVNPAFETLLGWNPAQFLGQDIQPLIDLETPLANGRHWYGYDRLRWQATVKTRAGVFLICDVQSTPIRDDALDRYVLSLRPAQIGNEHPADAS